MNLHDVIFASKLFGDDGGDSGDAGDSDFSTAEVTIQNQTRQGMYCAIPTIQDGILTTVEYLLDGVELNSPIVLYNGTALIYIDSQNIIVTGDIVNNSGYLTITGNGSITITDGENT